MKARPFEGHTWLVQLTLTLKMTTAKVFQTSVAVNNSPIQDCNRPDDHIRPNYYLLLVTPYSDHECCIIVLR